MKILLAVVGIAIAVVGLIVQVLDYLHKRREKLDEIPSRGFAVIFRGVVSLWGVVRLMVTKAA